ncbi:MAG: glycosyltransferase [Candidatus Hermodarchaeota archaeon]
MNILTEIQDLTKNFLKFVLNVHFIMIFIFLIITYHFLLFLIIEKNYIKLYENLETINPILLIDLIELPIINIIVPAWKEGAIFKGCLLELSKLSYPNLNIIVNAGGSKQTVDIANSFKDYKNFNIIYQKIGEGKLKAINDCLNLVQPGIIYLIDADVYLSDEIFLKMISFLINNNEKVVVSQLKPHRSIIKKDLVKYICINRDNRIKFKLSKYINRVGPHTCMKFEVIEAINKFSENRNTDDGLSIGMDLSMKGYKVLLLNNVYVESFNYPDKIFDYFHQNLRWIENNLFYYLKYKKFNIIKFIGLFLFSFYLFLTPFLLFINIYLFLIGINFILYQYLKKIRKVRFYKKTIKESSITFTFLFYLKVLFYIYIDSFMNIIVFFELLFYRKAYKKRKNLLKKA